MIFYTWIRLISTEKLLSYSIPKGVQRGLEVDLSDQTYDGRDEGDQLVGGLGQLVDGQRGTDNFRSDIHGFGKGMHILLFENLFECLKASKKESLLFTQYYKMVTHYKLTGWKVCSEYYTTI